MSFFHRNSRILPYIAVGRPGIRKKYSPGVREHPQSHPMIFAKKKICLYIYPRNPIFVVAPISSALDLAIYSVYKFWGPSRLVRNALVYRHFSKIKLDELSMGELVDPQIAKPAREGDFWVAPFLNVF